MADLKTAGLESHMQGVNVKSEIGNLKKVILHRPGDELLNLTPNTLEELLFDDIPFLPVAQEEHDAYPNQRTALGGFSRQLTPRNVPVLASPRAPLLSFTGARPVRLHGTH